MARGTERTEGGLTRRHIEGHMGRKAVGCPRRMLERCVYKSKNSESSGSPRSGRSPGILPWSAANLVPGFLVPGHKRCGGEPLYPKAEAPGGSTVGSYLSSSTGRAYYGLQKAVWRAEAGEPCGWAPGNQSEISGPRSPLPHPTPSQEGEGLPREG